MGSKLKTYEWRGTDEFSLALNFNGVIRHVSFAEGKEKPRINARLETADPEIQEKIEANYLYRVGQIKLKSTRSVTAKEASDNEAANAEANKPVSKAGTKGVFTSVTTLQAAADKLIEKYGIAAEEVQTPEQILAKAQELGASFPNLLY